MSRNVLPPCPVSARIISFGGGENDYGGHDGGGGDGWGSGGGDGTWAVR